MSWDALLYVVCLLIVGGLYIAVIGKVWRGTSGLAPGSVPMWWPFGPASWRGLARAYPALGAALILMFASGVAAELATPESAAFDAAMGVGLVALLGATLLYGLITLLNRPRFLVPPPLRSEPGWLAERKGSRPPRRPRRR